MQAIVNSSLRTPFKIFILTSVELTTRVKITIWNGADTLFYSLSSAEMKIKANIIWS